MSFVRIYATPVLSLTSRISISRPGQLTCLSRAAGPHVTIGVRRRIQLRGGVYPGWCRDWHPVPSACSRLPLQFRRDDRQRRPGHAVRLSADNGLLYELTHEEQESDTRYTDASLPESEDSIEQLKRKSRRRSYKGEPMPTKFEVFAALHVPGDPVILYNIWDVGSAHAVILAGAKALATGSHPVADANGWPDGQGVPIDFALANARRIADSTELPLTVDFEGAYSDDPDQGADNVVRLAATGAVGCNFEDQVIGGEGLHPLALQAKRIEAIRRAVGDHVFSSTPAPTCTSRRRRMTRRWSTKRSSAGRPSPTLAPAVSSSPPR